MYHLPETLGGVKRHSRIPLKKIGIMIHILTLVMVLIANQDKFVVFRNTAETVGSTITLLLVECHRRYKR